MRKTALSAMMFLVALGVFALPANVVLAEEHGGSAMQGQEHGGGEMAVTEEAAMSADAATLKEAAGLLKESNPELAAKLEKMAEKM